MATVKSSVVEYDYPIGQADITRPVILQYDGMRFRKCATSYRGFRPTQHQHNSAYDEEEVRCDQLPSCIDAVEDILDCKELSDGSYQIEITVPSIFFKYVIGKQGKVKQTIERDTKSQITIPKQGSKGGPIIVQAKAKRSLNSAKQRIEVIVWSNRQREDPTHFIGIALHSNDVLERVAEFNRQVLRTCDRIDESILQQPIRMHLTLSVLRLFSDDEVQQAITSLTEIIRRCKKGLKSCPLLIRLKGLNCMNDDYSSVDVVYSEVSNREESGLQRFADQLVREMITGMSDYVKEEHRRDDVKLHATVINSTWRRTTPREDQFKGKRPSQRQSFDATKIFKTFKDYDFGSCELTEVMLLNIKEKKDNGFYKCISKFDLNN